MTTKAETELSEKEATKEALKARAKEIEAKEKELNKERTGKGTRVFIGMTRGRNPQMIQYEAFDESQPDTLPKDLAEFMNLGLVGVPTNKHEDVIVGYLIDGFNSASYTAASDPVAEFVDLSWPEDVQKQFRLVVRNYAGATECSIEDAVALIKPGIVKSQEAAKAALAK
jgi:hypothetical protein